LRFPTEFLGRGDMSRGGLLLRCAAQGRELIYVPVAGSVRHGTRPARLESRSWKGSPFEFQSMGAEQQTGSASAQSEANWKHS
jgi:hypothetical protein